MIKNCVVDGYKLQDGAMGYNDIWVGEWTTRDRAKNIIYDLSYSRPAS